MNRIDAPKHYSIAVQLVAAIQLSLSILSLFSGGILLLLVIGRINVFSANLTGISSFYKGLIISGVVISCIGIGGGWGLWRHKRWGWGSSVGFQGLCIGNNLLAVIAGQAPGIGTYVSVGVCTAMIGVLCLPLIRQSCVGKLAQHQ